MKRPLVILLLSAVLSPALFAQEVVIDPSQIAASATNAAEQIDYMFDQLSELANLGDKLSGMKTYIDDVFGEDGIGGKAINVLQDLGTLERLTDSFNDTMTLTSQYAKQLQGLGKSSLTDTNMMLSYMNSAKTQAELAVATAKKILSTLGFTKKEKKDELEKLIKEIEESNAALAAAMEIETESTIMAEGLVQLMDFIDDNTSTETYIAATQNYGSATSAASRSIGIFSIIMTLLALLATAYGTVIYIRGGVISGDPTSANIFVRIGVGTLAALFVFQLISEWFHLSI